MNPNLTAFEEFFWTLPFLKQLKHDFWNNPASFFCIYSASFAGLWQQPESKEQIKKMARDFLVAIGDTKHQVSKDFDIIFELIDEADSGNLPQEERREIRLQFLDHEIARLTAK